MKRARRFPQRLVRWTSLCVCFARALSCRAIVPFASALARVAAVRRVCARRLLKFSTCTSLLEVSADDGN